MNKSLLGFCIGLYFVAACGLLYGQSELVQEDADQIFELSKAQQQPMGARRLRLWRHTCQRSNLRSASAVHMFRQCHDRWICCLRASAAGQDGIS